MWSRNALTERLNLKWPILQAPMGWLSTPALAAAVSNAGGLGGRRQGANGLVCRTVGLVGQGHQRVRSGSVSCRSDFASSSRFPRLEALDYGLGPECCNNSRRLPSRYMGRDALPAPVAKLPVVRVAARPGGAIGFLVACLRVDDGESPRIRMTTSCSRMFLTVDPRPICSRNALRSTREPSGFVLRKSAARLASNQATSASSTERM